MYYVYERAGLRKFLAEVACLFEVWIYTASAKDYADAILEKLDPTHELITKRLYRENCYEDE